MPNETTQEQLKKWASERDAILSESYLKSTENLKLSSANKELSDSIKKLIVEKIRLEQIVSERTVLVTDISRLRIENSQLLKMQRDLNQEILTQQEQVQLKSWVGKRDAMMTEISNLQIAKDKLLILNREMAESNTDIESRINFSEGRIVELSKKEQELPLLISKEVASLQSQKSSLETQIMSLSTLVGVLTTQKTSLKSDVANTLAVFDIVKGQALSLDKIVDYVTTVSESNILKINLLVSNLGKSLEEIIAVNKKNVFETNVVIEKLPKMLVELQKRHLIINKI